MSDGTTGEALFARKVSKRFGETIVLDVVDLDIPLGKVTGLVGENGAGKSTLMNILSGQLAADSGEVHFPEWHTSSADRTEPSPAQSKGVSRVTQEQSLVGPVPVFENLLLGADAQFAFAGQFLNRRRMVETARHMMDLAECTIDVRRTTSDLSFSQRQLVEVIRACLAPSVLWGIENPVVLLDEPTASLEREDEAIFRDLVARTREKGGLLFVSHRLGEVLELADAIVVLKDGRTVASVDPDTHGEKELHRLMVGRERDRDYYHEDRQLDTSARTAAIEVRGLSREGAYRDVSFSVAPGEIFGIGGLLESGKSDCAKGLSGVVPPQSGEVRLTDGQWHKPAIADMIAAGLAYVPSERLVEGMIAPQPVGWNLALGNGDLFSSALGFWRHGEERKAAEATINRVGVKADGPSSPCHRLSGGNQQKVVLGRWLLRDLKVLVLDNPTRGVDAGAKEEIYSLIRDLTDSGVAVILISDELLELIGLSNRIAIMRHGRIETVLDADIENKPTEQALVETMLSGGDDTATQVAA